VENGQNNKQIYNQSYDEGYNQSYSQNYKQRNNQNYEYNGNLYERKLIPADYNSSGKGNNGLIIFTLCLATVSIIACVVLSILLLKDSDEPKTSGANVKKEAEVTNTESSETTTIPVGKTMYVEVNDYLVLRSGPGTEYSEKTKMYRGDAVYVIEYVTDDFAKIIYDGTEGYASRHYLSDTKPEPLYTWNYNEDEIETVVAQSLRWYVNAVTTGSTDGAENYFSGKILQTEIDNATSMSEKVESESLQSVRCHTFKRLSPTRVSVVRESDIEIVEFGGKSRIASEMRVYVLENTGSGTYIVDIHK